MVNRKETTGQTTIHKEILGIEKLWKEDNLIPLTHKYMTGHFPG
jgi:hypothetical protein